MYSALLRPEAVRGLGRRVRQRAALSQLSESGESPSFSVLQFPQLRSGTALSHRVMVRVKRVNVKGSNKHSP